MQLLAWTTVLCAAVVTRAPDIAEAGDRDPARNAALQYWQALVHLPEDPRWTQWEAPYDDPLTVSMEDAKFLFDGAGISRVARWAVEALQRGAQRPYCEWGLPVTEDGPYTMAHHTQRSATATGLLVLQARLEHARGDQAAAVDTLNAAWTFLRHLSQDHTMVSWAAHFGRVEQRVAPLAASWIPEQVDESAVRRFRAHLDDLPEPSPFGRMLQSEGEIWLVWLPKAADKHGLPWVKDRLVDSAEGPLKYDGDEAVVHDVIDGFEKQLTSEEELRGMIEETRRMFDEASRIAALPYPEFGSAMAGFQEQVAASNPLVRLLLGRYSHFNRRPILTLKSHEFQSRARLAMFRAAVALRLEGRKAFERVDDPFGDGPFQYEPLDGGYVLTSELVVDGEPFSMIFGQEAVPEPKKTPRLLIYDPEANPSDQIEEALQTAQAENKRVLLQWGFNGCIPCYKLHRVFEEAPRLSKLVQDNFIHVPISTTHEATDALAEEYRVPLPGVPHLTVLAADGSVLANVKPANRFQDCGNFEPRLIAEFLSQWVSQAEAHE